MENSFTDFRQLRQRASGEHNMDRMIYRFDPQPADKALKTLAKPAARSFSLDITSSQVKHLTDLPGTKNKASAAFKKKKKKPLGVEAQYKEDESLGPKQVLKV